MKVLIVASYNKNSFVPFVKEQAEALQEVGCIVDFYGVVGKGVKGYLSALPALKQKISDYKPDVIHAHFGLCGLLANLQRNVPVVTTYHGCDINDIKLRPLSFPSLLLSKYNLFVSKNQKNKEYRCDTMWSKYRFFYASRQKKSKGEIKFTIR